MVPVSDSTILVVEPDPTTRSCIQDCLCASFGDRYRVVTAATGHAGYEQLDRLHPQLMIMETDLPDGEGTGLIRRARQEIAPAPTIIVCTHRRGVSDKIAAFEAGADDYLVKPLNAEHLALRFQLTLRFQQLVSGRPFGPLS